MNALREDAFVFSKPDVATKLGVGKNMASSIRYWCQATGMVSFQGKEGKLTNLGELIFGSNVNLQMIDKKTRLPPPHTPPQCPSSSQQSRKFETRLHRLTNSDREYSGTDPYLEDPATLWLLHWQLTSTPTFASTWYLAFTCWNRSIFTHAELLRWLERCSQANTRRVSLNTLERDIRVFLRTYLPKLDIRRNTLEESFDCPLAELGLIRRISANQFQFERRKRPSLPPEILAYSIFDYWKRTAEEQNSLVFERLMLGSGSPGSAFKLDEKSFIQLLYGLPEGMGLKFDETAGQRIVFRNKKLSPLEILKVYYRGQSSD